jgi:hypothetical protein
MNGIDVTKEKKKGIVCAVRTGPENRPTITQAVTLAKDSGLPLCFLYVANLNFLSHTSPSHRHTILKAIHQMGKSTLLAAQTAASTQGIAAWQEIRQGDTVAEIISLCRKLVAEYVVLNQSLLRQQRNISTPEQLIRFIDQIEQESGAKVILVKCHNDVV